MHHNLRKGPMSLVVRRGMGKNSAKLDRWEDRRGRKSASDDAVTEVAIVVFEDTGTRSGPSARAVAR
ncbi:hypothetical protein CEXT_784111 [Caerostris extrusa]|uniref:Uncharacterized protein n=1 Tax=Caerostris extrusa TaxID=172846 RepID=A0AAV4SFT5_CAEEX|nr:hypothetical protein CEXT_784111 [Caerostris extrusa]